MVEKLNPNELDGEIAHHSPTGQSRLLITRQIKALMPEASVE